MISSTCVERRDWRISRERAFLWDSDSSSLTGAWNLNSKASIDLYHIIRSHFNAENTHRMNFLFPTCVCLRWGCWDYQLWCPSSEEWVGLSQCGSLCLVPFPPYLSPLPSGWQKKRREKNNNFNEITSPIKILIYHPSGKMWTQCWIKAALLQWSGPGNFE